MASPLLQDAPPAAPPDAAAPAAAFRPFASPAHAVARARYITSNDPRGYLPVFEYCVHGQWLMVDADDGYVLWTGIWKALGNAKADIVKLLDSQPDLAPQLRRVRGGYLKIQGTWIKYEVALRLARRVAWPIRDDLVPIFGPTFPSTCLAPGQPGYGQLAAAPARRRARRAHFGVAAAAPAPPLPLPPPAPAPPPRLRTPPRPHYAHAHAHAPPRYAPYPPPPPRLPPISALTATPPTSADALRRLRADDAPW